MALSMTRHGEYHPEGRGGYLQDVQGPSSPRGLLTQKVDLSNGPLRVSGAEPGEASSSAATVEGAGDPKGLPWITQILGSGLLAAGVPASEAIRRHWVEQLADVENGSPFHEGPALRSLVRGFVASLFDSHVSEIGDLGSDIERLKAPPYLQDLFLVTALLTNLYHRVRATSHEALTPLGGSAFSLADGKPAEGAESAVKKYADVLHDMVRRHLRTLREELEVPVTTEIERERELILGLREAEMLDRLLGPMRAAAPTFQVEDLYLLTEICWHFVRRAGAIYPDWSELLLEVSFARADLDLHWRPLPTNLDHGSVASVVEFLLRSITRDSWEQREDKARKTVGRDSPWRALHAYYDVSARILVEQARIVSAFPASHGPPQAIALVTSLDIELELALWEAGEPFAVIMPVLFVEGYEEEDPRDFRIHHAWIAAKVTPESGLKHSVQLERLRGAERHNWFLMDSEADVQADLAGLPLVVRLTGCPLLKLPDLADGESWSTLTRQFMGEVRGLHRLSRIGVGSPGRRPLRLIHTIQLDEYTALRSQAADLMMGSADPLRWVTDAGASHSRFWMLAGVQLSDSGVRSRLATQALSSALSELQGGQESKNPNRASRRGVIVNRRTDAQTRDLLQWAGFDVVTDDARAFTFDLQHYERHLKLFNEGNVAGIHCVGKTDCALR